MSFCQVVRQCRFALFVISALTVNVSHARGVSADAPSPILVELFTSEGCSSCPPADAILQQLDRAQPVAGAQLIVLSEHVDYWNSLGWNDPYSSAFFSDRQGAYARHFGLASAYTPEMVVDGTAECLGSNSGLADRAIERVRSKEKIPVHISSVSWDGSGELRAHVDAGPLPASSSRRKAGLYLVAALDHAESEVARGENHGRHLTHVAVVLSLTQIGSVETGKTFSQDVRLKPEARGDPSNLRLIAFIQEAGPGRVLGAALQRVSK
jgi:hypothetical protein